MAQSHPEAYHPHMRAQWWVMFVFLAACNSTTDDPPDTGCVSNCGAAGTSGFNLGGSGGSQGGSGGEGGTGLGAPCGENGKVTCAEIEGAKFSPYSLICKSGAWEVFEKCDAGTYCNTQDGVDFGRCMAPIPECLTGKPYQKFCDKNDDSTTCDELPFVPFSVKPCIYSCVKSTGECGNCTIGSTKHEGIQCYGCDNGLWYPKGC